MLKNRTLFNHNPVIASAMVLLIIPVIILFGFPGCSARNVTAEHRGAQAPLRISDEKAFAEIIGGHTAGIVSANSAVTVTFTAPPSAALSARALEKVFSFNPPIRGCAEIDGPRLSFTPDAPLPSGTVYTATVNLPLLNAEWEAAPGSFTFGFSVIEQEIEVALDNMVIAAGDDASATVTVTGSVRTADAADAGQVERILDYSGRHAKLSWEHRPGNNLHLFTISGIPREEEDGLETVTWNGDILFVDSMGSIGIDIPARGDFRYMSFRTTAERGEAVSLFFSMPIDSSLELEGLITIDDETPPLLVRDNRIDLYPTDSRNGTVRISRALKDATGKTLDRDVEFVLPKQIAKPSVTMLCEGGILPDTEGLVIPFEATGLKALDVQIIRVYESNLLQFLQVNDSLHGDEEIRRVGRPVAFETISLEGRGVDNLYEPNRFNIDISDLVQAEPGALYQARITFRRSQALYTCGESFSEEDDYFRDAGEWDAPDDSSYWNYYYPEGYNWSERNDPCSNSYYMRKEYTANILASDIGIIAKRADTGGITAWVSSLVSTEALSGVRLTLYNLQQRILDEATTDADGYAFLETDAQPFALVAALDDSRSVIRLDDASSLTMSDFDIEGITLTEGLKGFIYAERGVWRPGDPIHLSFILEDREDSLPENFPVTLELRNPSGSVITTMVNAEPTGAIYHFPVQTPSDAPTGNWTAVVKAGGAEFSKRLKIETIEPNRLKIDLSFPKERLTREDLRQLSGELRSTWLHGAPARNLETRIEMQMQPIPTRFDGYPGYTFDDPTRSFSGYPELIFEERLDSEGRAAVPVRISDESASSGFLNLAFQTRVFEEGGAFSYAGHNVTYSPYPRYAGLKTPAGDAARGMLLTDQEHTVDIVLVDDEGTPAAGRLEVEMYKLSWRWWWDKTEDDLADFLSSRYAEVVDKGTVWIRNGRGRWKFRIDYPSWGRYLIRVSDPVSGHAAGRVVYMDWPGWAGTPQRGDSGAVMLSFFAEKESYYAGETARVTIPSSREGRILVSLENGSRVIDSWWEACADDSTTIEFPIKPEMAPTLYVNATYIQPHGNTANDLPIRMYGVIPLEVIDPETVLEPVIEMNDVLRPEGRVTIDISETHGRAMAYTLAVVDEGLLDLTAFPTPRPWDAFNAREALGVKTWDIYDDVINAQGADFGTLLPFGGGREEAPIAPDEANRFAPVVEFMGPFELRAGETAEHSFTMPMYVGSVRTMVAAVSDSGYGHADKTVPVKNDLMVLGTLPRVLGPEERIKIPVDVFSMIDAPQRVTVSIETEGPLQLAGERSRTVSFNGQGDQYVYFDALTGDAPGTATIRIEARSATHSARHSISAELRFPAQRITRVQDYLLEPGENIDVAMPVFGMAGTAERTMEVSSLPPINLAGRLDYLIRYPHGCVEQTVSAVFPQINLAGVTELSAENHGRTQDNIRKAIDKLQKYQTDEGGFSYWPGSGKVSDWGTSYAGHFLTEAAAAGYAVPRDMLDRWIEYQEQTAMRWRDAEGNLLQAYRLYTLANAGVPSAGAMNRMREKVWMTKTARPVLAAAYALSGRDDAAEELMDGFMWDDGSYRTENNTYGSRERDTALVVLAHLAMDRPKEAYPLIEELADSLGGDGWMSTQSCAFALLAVAQYLEQDPDDGDLSVTWTMNGRRTADSGGPHYMQRTFPAVDSRLSLTNTSAVPVYVQLIETGVPTRSQEREESRSLTMETRFYPKEENPMFRIDSLESGTDFIAEVTITNPSRLNREEMVLSFITPGGWEIINPRMTQQNFDAGDVPEYQDFRDDRIYTYFDLAGRESVTYRFLLNAAYQGSYYLPGINCEMMYDDAVYARSAGRTVNVTGQ